MNHLAVSIPLEKFDEYAERLRSKGVDLYILNHEDTVAHANDKVTEATWIRSMYFRDPNGIHMELAALTRAWRPDDVKHDPVDAKGQRVPSRRRAMA
jgi:hypothetical protein